jgi:hypothetical protein
MTMTGNRTRVTAAVCSGALFTCAIAAIAIQAAGAQATTPATSTALTPGQTVLVASNVTVPNAGLTFPQVFQTKACNSLVLFTDTATNTLFLFEALAVLPIPAANPPTMPFQHVGTDAWRMTTELANPPPPTSFNLPKTQISVSPENGPTGIKNLWIYCSAAP